MEVTGGGLLLSQRVGFPSGRPQGVHHNCARPPSRVSRRNRETTDSFVTCLAARKREVSSSSLQGSHRRSGFELSETFLSSSSSSSSKCSQVRHEANETRRNGKGFDFGIRTEALSSSGALDAGNERSSISQPAATSSSQASESENAFLVKWISAFVRFTRPHTMFGTAVSVSSVSLLALRSRADFNVSFVWGVVIALTSALAMNISIVGLNQLYDIEIDKVNKPYLPLASGEFSVAAGRVIVISSAVLSLAIGFGSKSLPLVSTLVMSLLLGIAYSIELPLLRWKRSPFLAAMCILAVRALIVQLGFFSHITTSVMGLEFEWTSALMFGTGFMVLFSVAIALFKDLPDILGDKKAGLQTFSVRLGPKLIFRACIGLLLTAYVSAIGVGLLCCNTGWSRIITTAAHFVLGTVLLDRSKKVDVDSSDSLYGFYMFIWKLFYAEYLLLPLIR